MLHLTTWLAFLDFCQHPALSIRYSQSSKQKGRGASRHQLTPDATQDSGNSCTPGNAPWSSQLGRRCASSSLRAQAAKPHTLFGQPIAHDQASVHRVLSNQGMQYCHLFRTTILQNCKDSVFFKCSSSHRFVTRHCSESHQTLHFNLQTQDTEASLECHQAKSRPDPFSQLPFSLLYKAALENLLDSKPCLNSYIK